MVWPESLTSRHELAVRPRERTRHLRHVRMVGTGVDLQLLHHRPPEPVSRKHSLHREANDLLRLGRLQIPEPGQRMSARIERVSEVNLVVPLPPRHPHLLRVDHDHVIAHIQVRRIGRLALSLQDARDLARQPSQDLPLGIRYVPILADLRGAHRVRAHPTTSVSWVRRTKRKRLPSPCRTCQSAPSEYGGPRKTPGSVTIALMHLAGVTSKAGFRAVKPSGATGTPRIRTTSDGSRSSITIPAPLAVAGSIVEDGATTTKGMPASRAASARPSVPILFAVSPFRAIRSAPTSTPWIPSRRIEWAAAESTIKRAGTRARRSSHAVRRAPWRSGRVSVAHTSIPPGRVRCSSRRTARAVPPPPVARPPVLQGVRKRLSVGKSEAPWDAMARDAARSSSQIASASARTTPAHAPGSPASPPFRSAPRAAARTRWTAQARLTAVGRDEVRTLPAFSSRAIRSAAGPPRDASTASASAAAIPIAGAPRIWSRAIAAAIASAS